MTKNSQCLLCKALDDTFNNGNDSKIENRLLYETDSFVITPCISPLLPGHVLITSKTHYQNLSLMNEDSIKEINAILEFISNNLYENYSNYLLAEHGAYDSEQNSGACIIHTHLHLIPSAQESLQTFDKLLGSIELNELLQIKDIDYPYILASSNDMINVYNAENVPSQMIRSVVLATFGDTKNWDWRKNTNKKYNNSTLKIWKYVRK